MEIELPTALESGIYLIKLAQDKKCTITINQMKWMLYLSQGISLSCYKRPLFCELIWRKLKVPDIDEVSENVNKEIIAILHLDECKQIVKILEAVFEEYYQKTDKMISNEMMAHDCWIKTEIGKEITINSIESCFSKLGLLSIKQRLGILTLEEKEKLDSIKQEETKEANHI